ncbi:MAG TPA: hypothetical protein VFP70_07035 [Burkholderiales bacterium]|nr:hypothetical protein [Burkholderiales bacterium]
MKASANVLIDFSGSADSGDLAGVEKALGELTGVGMVTPARKPERVLMVWYDPLVVSTREIRARAVRNGLTARLVGL